MLQPAWQNYWKTIAPLSLLNVILLALHNLPSNYPKPWSSVVMLPINPYYLKNTLKTLMFSSH